MHDAFKQLIGLDAYDFQIDAAHYLLDGHNVVLQAPTGAGKTFSAIFPFIYAKQQKLPFADRLLYALPQRTLTVALYEQVKEKLGHVLPKLKVCIQTGNMPNDSFFEADIVFTTIDQLLSAYIGVPVSLPRKRANLPAAGMLGAYVVFDEFHLLEPARALATALDLAERLSRYTRLLLMSATVPDQAVKTIAQRMRAELIQLKAAEVQTIPSQQKKERRFIRCEEPLSAAAILGAHEDRSIAVVNRVERAQQLYEDAKRLVQERGLEVELLLLHARFLPEDRKRIEARILELFKRGSTAKAILIATQVIEVGLDISTPVLHSELAPANSIFQRAGRCARYQGERGTVYVYDLPLNAQGKAIYGPYLKEAQELVDETGRQLAERNDCTIGFVEEREIVDRVHTAADLKLLREVGPQDRCAEIEDAMRTGEASCVRRLIRDVDSVNVIVHDNPNSLRMDQRPQSFSINRSVMHSFLSQLDLKGRDAGCLWIPKFDEQSQGEAPEETWQQISQTAEARNAVFLVIRPTHAHYDTQLGLQLGYRTTPSLFHSSETLDRSDAGFDPFSYTKETYEEHIRLVIQQHDAQTASCEVATALLARAFRVTPEALEGLSRLVAALHDVGKLADGWQRAIWRWQEEIHKETRNGFLAHSQFDGSNAYQRQRQRESKFKKPPHAVEGAFAVLPILASRVTATGMQIGDIERVTFALASAIARHHSAFSAQLSDYALSPAAHAEALRVASLDGAIKLYAQPQPSLPSAQAQFKDKLVAPQRDGDAFLVYWYVARRLRLADQQATAMAGGHS